MHYITECLHLETMIYTTLHKTTSIFRLKLRYLQNVKDSH